MGGSNGGASEGEDGNGELHLGVGCEKIDGYLAKVVVLLSRETGRGKNALDEVGACKEMMKARALPIYTRPQKVGKGLKML